MDLLYYFCVTFVVQLMFNVVVGSLHEDSGEDPGSWTCNSSTVTRKSVWPTLIIFHIDVPPTLNRAIYCSFDPR